MSNFEDKRWLVTALAVCFLFTPSSAATPEQVEVAVQKAKNYVYSQQKPNGTWELVDKAVPEAPVADVRGLQYGGLTAVALNALLAAGENPNDPKLVKAIAFLKTAPIRGVYALAMRQQVWVYLQKNPDTLQLAKQDAKLMMQALIKEGKDRGYYSYQFGRSSEGGDRSAGQYGVLGMWAAETVGVEVPMDYWRIVERAWIADQEPSGAWLYRRPVVEGRDVSINMTAGGVATLFVTQDFTTPGSGVACKGNLPNPAIDKGLDWLSTHLPALLSDQGPDYAGRNSDRVHIMYGMYGLERAGVASGRKYLGTTDWYRAGSDHLIKIQEPNGKWPWYDDNIPGTCFGILFFAHGRAPVAINKLQYEIAGKEAHWNQRPRDAANLSKWMGRQFERQLNWQIVNLRVPSEDLDDAPILYITGDQTLTFTDEEVQKLARYIEAGGMIVGNADCGNKLFADSFRSLGKKLYPAYEFRPLDASHPIMTSGNYRADKFKVKPNLHGLSNGVRELMLLCPDQDLSRVWQIADDRSSGEPLKLGANIFSYCNDQSSLKTKGASPRVTADPKRQAKRKLSLARLQYAGNWDPEPGGMRRLAAILHNKDGIDIETTPVLLGSGKLGSFKLAYLTGTDRLNWKDNERDEVAAFLKSGGVLLADAAGGSHPFIESFESEIDLLYPSRLEKNRALLDLNHPLYRSGEAPIAKVSYRSFARQTLGRLDTPQLHGFSEPSVGNVIYSKLDLCHGLLGVPVDGVSGYSPESATDVFRAMIRHSAQLIRD